MVVPLDREQELRFERLMETLLMVDLHKHPQVRPEDITELNDSFRSREYAWGYEATRAA